jgi:hypothetical protein
MINKIYKRIHNKYSTLFKFIFFMRYLLGIFIISLALFLFIPHFIDFKKKDQIIKNYLLESYGLKIIEYEDIKYNSLPVPNLEIKNIVSGINVDLININSESLIIYPKLLNIYNYKIFEVNKIVLNRNRILLSDSDLKNFINYIYNLKKKLIFKNLDLKITRKKTPLINIKKINFSNYGYNKNIIRGKLFDKKFKININDSYDKIKFKLLKSGIIAEINFSEANKGHLFSGSVKSKLLNSNLKFNFDYDNEKLKIYNSYFRNKDLSFNNESTITYRPFFSSNSNLIIEDINTKIFKYINVNKIFASKNLIKKLNTKAEMNFQSKRFSNNLIDNFNVNINLTYGRLTYLKKISISDNFFSCQGDINLLTEYPILYFDCSIILNDKKEFLKEFSIKHKNKNELFKILIKGNINILNNKINFKNIQINQDYNASKEDLNYFKQAFENILFDNDFSDIFNYKKIKEFILEIS